jgi:hypothetical protein
MKIRVIHTNGGMTTLENVEKLYFLEGEANVEVFKEPKKSEYFYAGNVVTDIDNKFVYDIVKEDNG